MLCIIPVLLGRASEDSIITGVKYFISQSSASVVFLISLILGNEFFITNALAIVAILFKLGVPPFHRWMLGIIFRINFIELLFILTLQKFTPLIILSQLGVREGILITSIVLRIILIITRININFSFHYMLFLSSVGNGMWIVVSLVTRVWIIFLILYCIILAGVVIILVAGKLVKFRDVASRDGGKKIIVAIHFFNLGGVPPLIGFAVKLMVLKSLTSFSMLIVLLLVMLSAMILYIYTRIIYQAFTVSPNPDVAHVGGASRVNLILRIPLLFSISAATWML